MAGYCLFMAVSIGILCTGGAQAAFLTTSSMVGGDVVGGSMDWTWAASNGDLNTLPLGAGQEYLSGAYSSSMLSQDGTYQAERELNNTDTMLFETVTKTASQGPGTFQESMMLDDAGMPVDTQVCNSLGAEAATCENVTLSAYNERIVQSSKFMTSGLEYQSIGVVGQADTEIPDSFDMVMIGNGNGYGQIELNVGVQSGIGNTTELGYQAQVHENIWTTGSGITIGKETHWSSFRQSFPIPESGEITA